MHLHRRCRKQTPCNKKDAATVLQVELSFTLIPCPLTCEIFNILFACSTIPSPMSISTPSTLHHHIITNTNSITQVEQHLRKGTCFATDINAIPATVNHICISKAMAQKYHPALVFLALYFLFTGSLMGRPQLNLQFNRLHHGKIYK